MGRGEYGRLGLGSHIKQADKLMRIDSLQNIVSVSACSSISFAVDSKGECLCSACFHLGRVESVAVSVEPCLSIYDLNAGILFSNRQLLSYCFSEPRSKQLCMAMMYSVSCTRFCFSLNIFKLKFQNFLLFCNVSS